MLMRYGGPLDGSAQTTNTEGEPRTAGYVYSPPAVALAVVLAAAFAALGGGRASAGQFRVVGQPAVVQVAAQAAKPAAVAPQPAAALAAQPLMPTEELKTGPDTDNIEQQDGPQNGA